MLPLCSQTRLGAPPSSRAAVIAPYRIIYYSLITDPAFFSAVGSAEGAESGAILV